MELQVGIIDKVAIGKEGLGLKSRHAYMTIGSYIHAHRHASTLNRCRGL